MAQKEPPNKQQKKHKGKEVTEVIGYPDKPMHVGYVMLAAAAWTAWLIFLTVMAYIRWHEWPFWPT
jgi:hypothetical protein